MTVTENLRKKLRLRMNDVTDMVATGGCADFAAYKFYCGMVQAFAEVERDLIDLISAANAGEDD